MTDAFEIRTIAEADHHGWLSLWRRYQVFYKVDLPDATTRVTFARILDPAEPINGALAFADGQAVGLVHYIYHRSTWTVGDYCYLQDLIAAEDLRGRGIGRALVAFVVARATEAGCARVHWLTHETNADARILYEKLADRSGFLQYRIALPDRPR